MMSENIRQEKELLMPEPAPGKESASAHRSIVAVALAICALLFFQQEIYVFGVVAACASGYFLGKMFYSHKEAKEREGI